MEQLLHYVWKHKIFPLQELHTTAGLRVEVIDPGLPNRNAGPDFFNAKVKIDGTLWVGNVEIHTISSDWYRHGHDKDTAYDTVILHIATQTDCEVQRPDGANIPQMQLACPEHVRLRYDELHNADMRPPCYGIVPQLSKLAINSWLTALQTERLEERTNVIRRRLERQNMNWEDTFFITLARNFGFGVNGDTFEAWAANIPFRSVDKHRDNLFQIEALFFGQAGLLDDPCDDEYHQMLKKEYTYLAHKFNLTRATQAPWKLLRMRPGNFPHVRIAQLAYLYQHEHSLFSRVMEAQSIDDVHAIFKAETSPYWEYYYIFGKPSPRKEKKLGKGSVDLILINTVVPFLYAYGQYKGNEALCNRAINLLECMKAENNHITKLWHSTGIRVSTAADSQAIIQLQKEYCDKKKCLYCRFGYEYLRNKKANS